MDANEIRMTPDYTRALEEYQSGRAEMRAGNYIRAIESFENSVRTGPHFKTLELLGECYLKTGRPLMAVVPLAAAIGLGRNAFRAMYLLAKAYSDLGRRRDALKFLDMAIEVHSDFKSAQELRDLLREDTRSQP